MPYVTYPNTSAYAATPQTSWYISNYVPRDIPAASDDITYVVETKYNYRPDLLAYDLYGNPNYWWVFCQRNLDVIRDPIWDFTTGITIIVPSSTQIKATLG